MASGVFTMLVTALAAFFIPAATAAAANCTVISCTNPLCENRPLEMRCTCQPGYRLIMDSLTCEEHTRVNNVLWPVFLTIGVVVVVGAVAVQIRRSRHTTRRLASRVDDNTRASMDEDPPSYTDVMSGSAGSGRSRGDSGGSSSISSSSGSGRCSSESGEVHSDSSSSLSAVFVCSLSERDLTASPPPPSYDEATLMLMLASQTGYPPPYSLEAVVTLK